MEMNLSGLQLRIVSALVIAPITLYIVWMGSPLFEPFLATAFAIALFEWVRLAEKTSRRPLFVVVGIVYVILAFVCFYFIRVHHGIVPSFLFLVLIWASDIDAYAVGKYFGGPKMSPTISPNKTWAGMFGAVISPAIIMILFYWFEVGVFSGVEIFLCLVFGLVLGLTAQAGDLLVSFLKRQAGAKDSGKIIPGHGGLLDRIDSLMLSAPVFLFLLDKMPHVIGQ